MWLRLGAAAAVLLLPFLLLPAAGFFAAGGLLLLFLLPLLCLLLPLGMLCFLPLAVRPTSSTQAADRVHQRADPRGLGCGQEVAFGGRTRDLGFNDTAYNHARLASLPLREMPLVMFFPLSVFLSAPSLCLVLPSVCSLSPMCLFGLSIFSSLSRCCSLAVCLCLYL